MGYALVEGTTGHIPATEATVQGYRLGHNSGGFDSGVVTAAEAHWVGGVHVADECENERQEAEAGLGGREMSEKMSSGCTDGEMRAYRKLARSPLVSLEQNSLQDSPGVSDSVCSG